MMPYRKIEPLPAIQRSWVDKILRPLALLMPPRWDWVRRAVGGHWCARMPPGFDFHVWVQSKHWSKCMCGWGEHAAPPLVREEYA
jgi:hypothetical protein